jgi:hypothetical protein
VNFQRPEELSVKWLDVLRCVGWNAYHDGVVIQSVLQSIGIALVRGMAIRKRNIRFIPLRLMRNKMFDEIMKYLNYYVI